MKNSSLILMTLGCIALGSIIGASATLTLVKASPVESKQEVIAEPQGSCSAKTVSEDILSIKNVPLKENDLPLDTQDALHQVRSQSLESEEQILKELALRIVLSKTSVKPSTPLSNIPSLKSLLPVPKISSDELRAFYEKNKASLPPNVSFDQVKGQMENYIAQQKTIQVAQQKILELEDQKAFKVNLKTPVAPLIEIDTSSYPFKGPKDAPHTLIGVSDYMCPHCRSVKPQIEELLKKHPDKIKYVQINFPLDIKGLSGILIQGSICAQKESMEAFWKYHAKAYEISFEALKPVSPNQRKEFINQAMTIAQNVGLDLPKFKACIDKPEVQKQVQKTLESLTDIGISATPTFYLDNRKLIPSQQGLIASVEQKL